LWISTSFRISGRDYDSILKTIPGDIIIDDDKEIAKKRVQQITRVPEALEIFVSNIIKKR
jgi:hypothetical protein